MQVPMTIESAISADAGLDWSVLSECGGVRAGTVAPAQVVTVAADRLDRMRTAMSAAVGDIEVSAGIADVCPDPLVFAVAAGLPRPTGFDRSIDGGSRWRDEAPLGAGPLYAVSQIADIAQRRTRDGRRLVRVVYSTRFTDAGGALVGIAEGTGIHIGGAP
ncbi:hypothetical protein DVS77_28315 [Mycolicibacterium moriokaense]|nr:hypothetical protein DVS77_28315 [Mycolicibacterium moriokaense]